MNTAASLFRSTRAVLGITLLGSTATIACIDGPFPHLNPTDPETEITFSIVGGADTVRTVGANVIFRVVSQPAVTGYDIHWSSSSPGLITASPSGTFFVWGIPGAMTPVTIRAEIGRRPQVGAPETTTVERIIYLGP